MKLFMRPVCPNCKKKLSVTHTEVLKDGYKVNLAVGTNVEAVIKKNFLCQDCWDEDIQNLKNKRDE